MKPLYRKVLNTGSESFLLRRDVIPRFTIPWHYHPEFELLYIVSGRGTRFVGDHIQPYETGDMVLVGENVPHFWHSDPQADQPTEAIVMHFLRDFGGSLLLDLPEMQLVATLLDRSRQGLLIGGATQFSISRLLDHLLLETDAMRLARLIEILHVIAISETDVTALSSDTFTDIYGQLDKRLQRVYDHVMMQFSQPIILAEVADMVSMTPSSFCRFFKATTQRTFVQFLNEVRIRYACKLLIAGGQLVGDIAFASGFETVSNFNKQFQGMMGVSPKEYQKKHRYSLTRY
jgi:AraC-like DNA-binding protein/quercetin dioxygenase-like cupin family protein